MTSALRKTALSVALMSLGLAMSVNAQNTGSSSTRSSATAPSSSSSAASPSGSAARSSGANATATAKGGSDNLAHGDRKFIEDAAQGGMAEVQLGQLAAQKGQSDQVKQFGQKMADDHGKANDQLKQVASSKNVTLPTDLKSADKREMDRLSKLSGADFDREYMKHMVSEHKKDVKEFQKEAKSAKDADVKSFASQTEPTLQQHLQLAQSTESAVRKEGRGNTAKTSAAAGTTSAGSMTGNSGATGSSSGTGSTSGTTGSKSSTKSGT